MQAAETLVLVPNVYSGDKALVEAEASHHRATLLYQWAQTTPYFVCTRSPAKRILTYQYSPMNDISEIWDLHPCQTRAQCLCTSCGLASSPPRVPSESIS